MRKASIKTLLEYTPYDNKCPSPFGIRDSEKEEEEKFYLNKLFVDFPDTCKTFRDTLSYSIEEPTIHLIVFSGSSGSGKTTFLKDFFRKKEEGNKYLCKYVNLVEYPSRLGDDETIATALKDGLRSFFSKKISGLLYKTFIEWNNKNSSNVLSFLGTEQSLFISFCESYAQEESTLKFEVEMENFNFYRNGDLTQLLSLYLISSIISYKDDDRPFVFVFDNLDEVGKQYLSSGVSVMIKNAYSIAQKYCEQVLHYYFSWNVSFLLSVRMENQRYLRVSDIQERIDILHATSPKLFEFSQEYQATYSDILNARLVYYENNYKSNEPKEIVLKNNFDSVRQLLRSEEVFFKRFIKPLYSYDYRMFTHFVMSDLLQDDTVYVPQPLMASDGGNDCHQGARGMLLFYSLAGLLRFGTSRFNSYVNEEFSGKTCNIYRMSFTLLSNLSGWSRREEELMELLEDKDDFNERTKQVEMSKFLETIEFWYQDGKDTFIPRVLEGLIGTSANSFECPILLFGNAIDKYVTALGDGFSISALGSQVVQDYLDDPHNLASVTIQINPLCIVYSARVFIHYEYFNLISPTMKVSKGEQPKYKPKPLFQFVDFEIDLQNIKDCLSYTFETAKTIIKKADNHFCKTCKARNNDSCVGDCKPFINKFKEDGFSFNNTIHATRIISAHIHYLDNYRYYLWNRIGNVDYHSEKEIEVQKIIIEQVLEYIDFYKDRKVRDDLYDTIADYWKQQYEVAIQKLNDSKQYPTIDLSIKKTKQNAAN